LALIKKRADGLANADRLGSLEIHAFVDAQKGEVEQAKAGYQKVLAASGFEDQRVLRYLVLLAMLGESKELKKVYGERIETRPVASAPAVFRAAAQYLGYAGWVATASDIRRRLRHAGFEAAGDSGLGLKMPAPNADGDGEFLSMKSSWYPGFDEAAALDELGVGESFVAETISSSLAFLRTRGYPVALVRAAAVPSEGGASIVMSLVVKANAEVASDVEWDLYGHLQEHELGAAVRGMSVALIADDSNEAAHAN